jgi:hypothetical protein
MVVMMVVMMIVVKVMIKMIDGDGGDDGRTILNL